MESINALRPQYSQQLTNLMAKKQSVEADLEATKDAIAQYRGALQTLDQVEAAQKQIDASKAAAAAAPVPPSAPEKPQLKVVDGGSQPATAPATDQAPVTTPTTEPAKE